MVFKVGGRNGRVWVGEEMVVRMLRAMVSVMSLGFYCYCNGSG